MRFFVTSAIMLASLTSLVTAQFNFFDHIFGNHPGSQQRQQPQQAGSQWNAHAETVSCSSYLCPDSLVCVNRPSECPCPYVEDVKCIMPDGEETEAGTVVCVRGASGCAAVERLARAYSK